MRHGECNASTLFNLQPSTCNHYGPTSAQSAAPCGGRHAASGGAPHAKLRTLRKKALHARADRPSRGRSLRRDRPRGRSALLRDARRRSCPRALLVCQCGMIRTQLRSRVADTTITSESGVTGLVLEEDRPTSHQDHDLAQSDECVGCQGQANAYRDPDRGSEESLVVTIRPCHDSHDLAPWETDAATVEGLLSYVLGQCLQEIVRGDCLCKGSPTRRRVG